ncbi:SCO6745 family protein [Aeromicrobium wangtongii]|uniref:MarR family transcriptional regulator n=1 Tax=Aeromicrobium wangtongii TaxID=2969247 RepID=A0ABY5M6C9_9ACTN|nr:MarR family transcriptional regulator [Aeromicrobium wangtongii]MCD9200117.1 MarR family transcriptional regulator [Aeromicrobium wangtongii]UUP13372.1 MarR family transcriptional regulator [Aeromicrobium wangtongii]
MTQSRPFWRAIEAIHDVVYFAPSTKERYGAIGLKGFWMGYAASRSAAVGTPSAHLVTALFHGFAPALVQRAIPDAWQLADRDAVLAARLDVARDALAPALDGADVARIARDLGTITSRLDFAGKPLAAAHADLPTPADEIGRLWHAATIIREYRGDCHVAVLTAAGLDGAAANALAAVTGLVPPGQLDMRGWTEAEASEAIARLATRGWVDAAGAVTDTGRAARAQIEDTTDRVCAAGFDREATGRAITVEESVVAVARRLEELGAITYPNPAGVQRP